MEYKIEYSKKALDDLEEYRRSGCDEELRKITELTDELRLHPKSVEGKVEELHHEARGEYSRRVNHENRMVYSVDDATATVTIASLRGHYGDH